MDDRGTVSVPTQLVAAGPRDRAQWRALRLEALQDTPIGDPTPYLLDPGGLEVVMALPPGPT